MPGSRIARVLVRSRASEDSVVPWFVIAHPTGMVSGDSMEIPSSWGVKVYVHQYLDFATDSCEPRGSAHPGCPGVVILGNLRRINRRMVCKPSLFSWLFGARIRSGAALVATGS